MLSLDVLCSCITCSLQMSWETCITGQLHDCCQRYSQQQQGCGGAHGRRNPKPVAATSRALWHYLCGQLFGSVPVESDRIECLAEPIPCKHWQEPLQWPLGKNSAQKLWLQNGFMLFNNATSQRVLRCFEFSVSKILWCLCVLLLPWSLHHQGAGEILAPSIQNVTSLSFARRQQKKCGGSVATTRCQSPTLE
jgi:hypothetical protein